MPRELMLFATAPAASDRLADELADGAASASDGRQGFHAFALKQAHPAKVLSRPLLGVFAQAAAARARITLAPNDCVVFAGVLSELHGSGATPAEVEAAGRDSGAERSGRQLAAALAAHAQLLTAQRTLDPGSVAAVAGARIAAGDIPFEFDGVRVEARGAWTQADLSLVAALGEGGIPVTIALPFDASRPELFAPLEKAHQELHRLERVEIVNVDPSDGAAPMLRERLRHLFDLGSEPLSRDASPIEAYTLPTAEAELRELARRIRALLRGGCHPDRIAVAASGEVLRATARILGAAGVPVAAGSERALAATLPGRAALGLLELAEGGIEREPLCRLLAAGLFPLGGPPGQRKRGTALAELLRTAGSLDHGSGSLLPPLRAHLTRQAKDGKPGPGLTEPWELARELDRAVAVIEALPVQGRVGLQASALWSALRQLGTTQSMAGGAAEPLVGAAGSDERAESQVAAAATALALERLGKVLGELASLRDASWPSLTRGEFRGLLAAALEGEPAPTGRLAAAGVALCAPAALIGRRFDHVFLPGLVDGETDREGDVLLPAPLREAICRRLDRPAALRPSGRAAQRRQERLEIYLACCSARLTLSGSAPRMDVGGSPVEAAPLLRDLARVAGRSEPEMLERPLLPVGELCLTRAEAIAAHWQDPSLEAAEPDRVRRLAQQAARERQRHEAIVAGRADPASGALAVGGDSLRDLLPQLVARLEKKPLSPSLLELLAGCGFRALCDRILDLGPPDERGEELAANEGGTVRHRCLKAGFDALRREGLLPLQGGDRRRRELQTLLAGAKGALDEYQEEMPVGHPTVWAAERRTVERQLVRMYGRELADRGWDPTYFELEFQPARAGAPAEAPNAATAASNAPQLSLWPQSSAPAAEPRREPIRIDLPGGPVLLGGKIDRVDRRPGALRVIDYKTGSIDSKQRQLADGIGETQLQLAIYALLVQQALAPGAKVDAAYVSISQAELSRTVAEVCDKQGIDLALLLAADEPARQRCRAEGLPNLVERIAQLVGRARAGDFPVTPGNCRYCDHVSACRVGPYYEELD